MAVVMAVISLSNLSLSARSSIRAVDIANQNSSRCRFAFLLFFFGRAVCPAEKKSNQPSRRVARLLCFSRCRATTWSEKPKEQINTKNFHWTSTNKSTLVICFFAFFVGLCVLLIPPCWSVLPRWVTRY
jgi:hypothetical protein